MAEMLPTRQTRNLVDGLTDYLKTTFALSNKDAQDAIEKFLLHPENGMFKGPYVRLRLPFEPAAEGWRNSLDFYGVDFPPYGHQANAFQRLSSKGADGNTFRRPQPTLVTTGTGSGKTESFIFPIVDHVLRAQRAGITGVKALILYPMNALANDQAGRLATLISEHPELGGIRAALYTGQRDGASKTVSSKGLITDRSEIRKNPPDILLTNYKMLDMLLLRHEDAQIWRDSATSLQYLVLDEFHTYDGAQGTDVAMLLRRLGLTLKSYWPNEQSAHGPTAEDRNRPLGRITPVATSATLGGADGSDAMLAFAQTIFGEPIGRDALVTESRMSFDTWRNQRPTPKSPEPRPRDHLSAQIERTNAAVRADDSHQSLLTAAKRALFVFPGDEASNNPEYVKPSPNEITPDRLQGQQLLDALRHHELSEWLVAQTHDASGLRELAERLFPSLDEAGFAEAVEFLSHIIALYSHARAIGDRQELTVETHLWVRELSRIEAALDITNTYRWGDDGTSDEDLESGRVYLPAIYCRHCGKNGWGAKMAPTETELDLDPDAIRAASLQRDSSFRALLLASKEAEDVWRGNKPQQQAKDEGLRYFHTLNRTLLSELTDELDADFQKGWIIPVQTHVGLEAKDKSRDDVCPSCAAPDAIRFVGSAIATLTSVAVSNLFGASELDRREKKALIFTDSVQDAAHRAGFIQARSHTFNLRTALRSAFGMDAGEVMSLSQLADQAMAVSQSDDVKRFKLVPPELTDREGFREFWDTKAEPGKRSKARDNVKRRLGFDAALEFGLQGRLGRTLELTGTVVAEVDAGSASALLAVAKRVWDAKLHVLPDVGVPTDAQYLAWVRGVLVRMRLQGGIHHEWLDSYIRHDGARYHVWSGRRRSQGMPAFPMGRPAPSFPVLGATKADNGLDPVTPKSSWYSRWTGRALGIAGDDAGFLARELFEDLARRDVLTEHITEPGGRAYSIPADKIMLSTPTEQDLDSGKHTLECAVCLTHSFGSSNVTDQLLGAPCLQSKCNGRLRRVKFSPQNFYRKMYASADGKRVVAREHTSLLDDGRRLAYENAFKETDQTPDAPNVLVATPTLEMGIDIGDLSCVMLASMPGSVASYVQRVGRAGRLTGNSLVMAFVRGRGEHLPKLYDPLSVINGEVRPPATYLQAEEILSRQFTAFLGDQLARDDTSVHPRSARQALKSTAPDSYLGQLLALIAERHVELTERFLSQFSEEHVGAASRERLAAWVRDELPGTIGEASRRWQQDLDDLQGRINDVEDAVLDLKKEYERRLHDYANDAEHPKVEESERDVRSAESQLRRLQHEAMEQRTEYWISKIESYGLLPNYTLIGDAVDLDVGISWRNEDSQFEATTETFSRGAGIAIHELAPGATFYAQGMEIAIDAVDLGPNQREIQYWQICPQCGWKHTVMRTSEEPIRYSGQLVTCPRCAAGNIEDIGSVHAVVVLKKVSAEIRRDEAVINDSRDDRRRATFDVVPLADIDPERVEKRWFVEDTGFGTEYLSSVDLTWLNLGAKGRGGATLTVAGQPHNAPRFNLCEYCGKQDTSTRTNSRDEHRFWCAHRQSTEEHIRPLLLARELSTQGVKIHLPPTITDVDAFALPTLKASLMLGLQEHLGGVPGQLGIMSIPDRGGDENRSALLIHDTVPGGTGYLASFRDPEDVFKALAAAWLKVRDCSCAGEGRRACHQCLLPFADRGSEAYVFRVEAERLLRGLLGLDDDSEELPEFSRWNVVQEAVNVPSGESALEMAFRRALKARLTVVNAEVTPQPGPYGERLRIRMPDGTRWALEPQEDVLGTRPDFILRNENVNVPVMTIYTDGRAFHADVKHNRVGDDAVKRFGLRLAGYVPWAITALDIERFEAGHDTTSEHDAWVAANMVPALTKAYGLSSDILRALELGSMEMLWAWMQNPDAAQWQRFADVAPGLTPTKAEKGSAVDAEVPDFQFPLASVAPAVVDGPVWWQRQTQFLHLLASGHPLQAAGGILPVIITLDDRPRAVGEATFAESWRRWLLWSNLLAFRSSPKGALIATTSVRDEILEMAGLPGTRFGGVGSDVARVPSGTKLLGGVDIVHGSSETVPELWRPALEMANDDAEERAFVERLIAEGFAAPTAWGEEIEGVSVLLVWSKARFAVLYEDADREQLTRDGWTVVKLGDVEAALAIHAQLDDLTERKA